MQGGAGLFVGVDLLEQEWWPISDTLEGWHLLAKQEGIEWLTASNLSTIYEWMPLAPMKERITL